MLRRSLPLILSLLAVGLAAAPAEAARNQTLLFEAPRDVLDPSKRPGAFAEMESMGVRAMRLAVLWRNVAPSPQSSRKPDFDTVDPSQYDWGQYDAAIQEAARRGWTILLTLTGPVPKWATEARRDNVTDPDPAEFAQFVEAAARKYADRVSLWSIWNEPNQPQFLKPQFKRGKPYSPKLYRQLYLAALKGFRGAELAKQPTVLMGETSPTGTRKVVAPLDFLRGTLCLNSRGTKKAKRCGKLRTAGYAHHAYTRRSGPYYTPRNRDDVTIGVLHRLKVALDRAGRAGAIPRRLPIYLTEFGIQSKPDPQYGVSYQRQSEFRALSERIAYYEPRVKSFSQYLLTDDEPIKGVPKIARYGGFESGLRTASGKKKPSLDGFRLALVGKGRGRRTTLWGVVRPASGPTSARIEYRNGSRGRFRPLTSVRTNRMGFFTKRVTNRRSRQWRLVWTAPDGTVYRGTPSRAYR